MIVTVCDWCPPALMSKALYHVDFLRISGTAADQPADLCQEHYEKLWAWREIRKD